MYSLGVCLGVWYQLQQEHVDFGKWQPHITLINYLLVVSITGVAIWGSIYEGLRLSQYLFLITFLALAIVIMVGEYSLTVSIIYFAVLLLIVLWLTIYGDGNLAKIKLVGPYEVGHKDFHLKESGIAVSAYYPIDKDEYRRNKNNKERNTSWFRYGDKSLLGMTRATADIGSQNHLPPWFYSYLRKIKMHTV